MRTIVAEDGDGQVLITLYESGRIEIAERAKPYYSWSPPRTLDKIADQRPDLAPWQDEK